MARNTLTARERDALGRAIRMLRAERQLSQEDVQAKGGLGQNALTRIESGAVSASLASLLRVAEGLGVPVSALMEAFEAQLGKGGR